MDKWLTNKKQNNKEQKTGQGQGYLFIMCFSSVACLLAIKFTIEKKWQSSLQKVKKKKQVFKKQAV